MLHKEILSDAQKSLLPLIALFKSHFGLVGGTAIALHIGHRESIDYDLFSDGALDKNAIRREIIRFQQNPRILAESIDEYTVLIGEVKVTFLRYPFTIAYPVAFDDIARLPDLLTLAAMKAYALGRRAKWKDYVDLFFTMKERHSLAEVVGKATALFGSEFNEKIFRTQLAYFDDIDYSEKIIWMPNFETEDAVIRQTLTQLALS